MAGSINFEGINHIKNTRKLKFINNKTSFTGNKLYTYKNEMTYLHKRSKNELYKQGIMLLLRRHSQEHRMFHAKLET